MKPAPAVSLLPPRHEWRVTVSPDYWPLRGYLCSAPADDGGWLRCGEQAIATCLTTDTGRPTLSTHGEPRCERHLGSIRWLDGSHVMQWRAVAVEPLPLDELCAICCDPIDLGQRWGLTGDGEFAHRACIATAIRRWVGRGRVAD